MTRAPLFQFPAQMRDLAERHVKQARAACRHFMDAASKTHDVIGAMVPETSLTASIKQVRQRTMTFAAQNMDAGFLLAGELAKAKDFKEMLEIQSRNAQLQMTEYSRQAQELGRLMADAAQNSQKRLTDN
jgi:phasin